MKRGASYTFGVPKCSRPAATGALHWAAGDSGRRGEVSCRRTAARGVWGFSVGSGRLGSVADLGKKRAPTGRQPGRRSLTHHQARGEKALDMTLPARPVHDHQLTGYPALDARRSMYAGLRTTGWTEQDAKTLLEHLGREAFHGSKTRDFKQAWNKNQATGRVYPKYYRVGTDDLTRCQYVILTDPQRSAVLVIDIDHPGAPGGTPAVLAPEVFEVLGSLACQGMGPNWVGINPISGKAQALWMIDPVYAGARRSSSNTRLLAVVTRELNTLLGGDTSFSHRFCRWPLHVSDDPTAYRWHCQHHEVTRLGQLLEEVREMTGTRAPEDGGRKAPQFASGRERILAAREAARQAKELAALDAQLPSGDELAGGLIDGVRVLWVREGRAARDETAFRHALAEGYRLRGAGERMTDAKIIDAYERAYLVAQAVGADDREPDMPKMDDRLSMARRVRGYVVAGKRPEQGGKPVERMNTAGRKALATMGRRGGQKAAQRWKTDPNYAQAAREPLEATQRRQRVTGNLNRANVLAAFSRGVQETGTPPTWREIAEETGLTERSVARHLRVLRDRGFLPS